MIDQTHAGQGITQRHIIQVGNRISIGIDRPAEGIARRTWPDDRPVEIGTFAYAPDGQRLTEVLGALFQSHLAGDIKHPPNTDRGIDQESPGIGQAIAALALQEIVDRSPDVIDIAKEVAWSYIKLTERAVSSQRELKRALLIQKPTQLVATQCCAVCKSKPRKKRTKASGAPLAPFHLLCTCGAFQWRPESYRGDPTEWMLDMSHKQNHQLWAIARHLGIESFPIDGVGLLSMASEIHFERRWGVTQAYKRAGQRR